MRFLKAYWRLTLAILRLYLRDPLNVALSLFLIVFMMVLFGAVMGDEPFQVELPIAVLDEAGNGAAADLIARLDQDDWLAPRPVVDEVELVELIRRAQVIAGLRLAPEFNGVPGAEGTIKGLEVVRDDQSTKWIDLGLEHLGTLLVAGHSDRNPAWITSVREVDVVKNRYIDFIFPGVLAMAIMQACLASGIVFLEARERGVLRRLQLTPLPAPAILGSFLSGRFLVVLLHIVVLMLVAVIGFQARILGSPWELMVVLLLGTLAFMALGIMVAMVAPTFESANLTVQMLSLPMSFLCGVFFEVESMPWILQRFVEVLPLTYLVEVIRGMVTLGVPLDQYAPQMLALAGWLVGSLLVCVVTYKHWNRAGSRIG